MKELTLAISIVCLTVLEITALLTKLDGQLFSIVVGAISSIATYAYMRRQK